MSSPRPLRPGSLARRLRWGAGWLLAAGVAGPLGAHGDDQRVLELLTAELARAPDADLHLRRGELHRHLRDWERAEADYAAAARLAPELAVVAYFRARARLEAGDTAGALPAIDRFLAAEPGSPEGWFLRAEIHAAAGRTAAAAADCARGIELAPEPRPEHYLRHARLLAGGGDRGAALAALEAGLGRLGPVVSLVEQALALELERGEPEAALRRIDTALAAAPRREGWLFRRGEVLERAGRPAEARAAYAEGLAALLALPERLRDTVPMEKLERDLRRALGRLTPP
ncbi:MAG: tetratricopeptide repeat protein [Verrucomicrobia bacterium]|nr:tetratricopeptide repeat protein [Verrucomicrobiota bacterium]